AGREADVVQSDRPERRVPPQLDAGIADRVQLVAVALGNGRDVATGQAGTEFSVIPVDYAERAPLRISSHGAADLLPPAMVHLGPIYGRRDHVELVEQGVVPGEAQPSKAQLWRVIGEVQIPAL